MINLFQASVNDQSLTYLYTIFGSMNGIIPVSGSQPSTGVSLTLLGTMFKTFNSVILAVGALIVVYVTIVGVMETAHEGQVMGKEWNNLWIPIRIVMGIGALVPTGSGYSGIQIVMMWVILQGIGAADTLWSTALVYVQKVGSPVAKITPPTGSARQGLQGLFKGLMCYKAASMTLPNVYPVNGPDNAYFCNPKSGNTTFCSSLNSSSFSPDFSKNEPYVMGPGGACGKFLYCDQEKSCTANPADQNVGPESLSCLSCKAQITALGDIFPIFTGVAEVYIALDYDYTKFYFKSAADDGGSKKGAPEYVQAYCDAKGIKDCTSENLPSPLGRGMSAPNDVIDSMYWAYSLKKTYGDKNFMDIAMQRYQDEIAGALATYMQVQANDPNSPLKGSFEKARANGWILAGSYYLMLSRSNSANLQASMPSLEYQAGDSVPNTPGNALYKYRNDYDAAQRLLALTSGTTSSGGGTSAGAEAAQAGAVAASDVGNSMKTMVTAKEVDPLTQLSSTGYILLQVGGALLIAFVMILLIFGIIANLSFMVIGTGLPTNPLGGAVSYILMILTPIFLFVIGILLSVGATLAIYIPLIPYTIFTIGAIGWMLSTIEAMVAGPLVALGVLVPSGHHKLLGKAEPALMLLFNIFLRPSLMIFGMFAAILLSNVVLKMINTGFATVFTTLFDYSNVAAEDANGGSTGFNPVALIFVLVFYVTLITVALNKTFSAIHVIPENVTRWIGGQGERYGEDQAVGEAKQAITGAVSKSSEAGQAASTSAREAKRARDDAKQSDKGGPKASGN